MVLHAKFHGNRTSSLGDMALTQTSKSKVEHPPPEHGGASLPRALKASLNNLNEKTAFLLQESEITA